MRSVLVVLATVVCVSSACGGEAPTPLAAPAAAQPSVAPKSTDTGASAAPPQKQLITLTTKSADARAALLKAWDLWDNGRIEESLQQGKQALALDADFAFGHTFLGMLTPGSAGQAELDKGVQLSAGLPDAERLFIEAQAAMRRQDIAKSTEDLRRVADLAPDDYHAQTWLGYTLFDQRDFNGAIAAFKKALEDNPSAVFVDGTIAWADVQLRNTDDAVAAARKYVDGAPAEGGSHQNLAAMLAMANQTKDAEAELQKALDLSPKTRSIYYDLATLKALDGDYAGARDLLDKSKAAEVQPADGLDRAVRTAWVFLAEGKNAEAFKLLDATEKDSDARKLPWPDFEETARAWASWLLGKPADALKIAQAAMPRCNQPESSEGHKADCRFQLLKVSAYAQVQLKKTADAQKTLETLEGERKNWPGNAWIGLGVDMLAQQVAALPTKDAKAIDAVLAKCPPDDLFARVGIVRQLESVGDKASADEARKDLLGRPVLDQSYPLIVRILKK